MAVTEQARRALHTAARATLGEEEGDTLMAITAPANTDLATRKDLERFEEHIVSRIELQLATSFGELRTEMTALRAEMLQGDADQRTAMIQGDSELRSSIEELRTELAKSYGDLGQRIERTANVTLRWVLVTFATLQGATAAYLNLLLR